MRLLAVRFMKSLKMLPPNISIKRGVAIAPTIARIIKRKLGMKPLIFNKARTKPMIVNIRVGLTTLLQDRRDAVLFFWKKRA